MLTGEAKTAYQREYMRRKRAGLPTATNPKPKEWKPTQRMIETIDYWRRVQASSEPWRLSGVGHQVIDGLTLDNDESWMEACRRYKRLQDDRRAERKREKQEAEKPYVSTCSFCGKPASRKRNRVLIGDGVRNICGSCIKRFAKRIATLERKRRR